MSTFTINVPATIANLGPGFDSFGMALNWTNRFCFESAEQDVISSATAGVPTDPKQNMVFRGIEAVYTKLGNFRPPIKLQIDAQLPLARGLGSSSTAIVAGVLAGNHLLKNPLNRHELCQLATELEGHPDNVVPAILGGVQLCDMQETSLHNLRTEPSVGMPNVAVQAYALPWPSAWRIALLIPPYPILTEDARRVLPPQPSRSDAIFNLRKASLLTYALMRNDEQAFARSLDDRLHQPYRGQLIAEFPALQKMALEHNALGTIISGSGSTIAIFFHERQTEPLIAALSAFAGEQPGMALHQPTLNTIGAVIEKS